MLAASGFTLTTLDILAIIVIVMVITGIGRRWP
jgi:hypothetical protein